MANQRSQITMSDAEVEAFLVENRVLTMATVGPDGLPHLVDMWYGLVDGAIEVPTGAGMGIDIDLAKVEKYFVRE